MRSTGEQLGRLMARSDEIVAQVEALVARGVPEAIAQELRWLALEVNGYMEAGGWDHPAAEALFVAEQLEDHAARFRELASAAEGGEAP